MQSLSKDLLTTTLMAAFGAVELPSDARLYLACSGGRDSLSLAYACYLLYRQGQIAQLPILLHVHHGWQQANDNWAALVASWADDYGFECQILKVNLPKNSESHARDARYHAMLSVMSAGDVLMLAHHAADQAETVLMRLINGAGVQGLSGIKSWQTKTVMIDQKPKSVHLWRPWLAVGRDAISAFAARHALPYVDDATNTDLAHARGLIRTQILPHLLSLNPKAVENIARSANLLGQSAALLDSQINLNLTNIDHPANQLPYQAVLPIADFFGLDKVAQMSVLHRWLQADEPMPPSQQFTHSVHQLMCRTDNDHASQLIWQACQANYVICRYDDCLYRYRQDVWQMLAVNSPHLPIKTDRLSDNDDDGGNSNHGSVWTLMAGDACQLQLICPRIICLRQVQKSDAINIGKHSYRAKKLAQKLRLPPWLRQYLWQITTTDGTYLVAPMMVWRLPDGKLLTDFAQMGRMVYNGDF
ncbi:tRNA lysidine(34) synthetase TilS [Moraxella marmotae]|uniref:tRNA lysidine(34) synthetase TilS n=1 Tax=Moraxella marmotae TaxID=3344520 RepID=UPI0035F3B91A